MAASEEAKEGVWIKKFMTELGVELYCDNNGAIVQAKKSQSHQKLKHVL
jgi:hypothetical protein